MSIFIGINHNWATFILELCLWCTLKINTVNVIGYLLSTSYKVQGLLPFWQTKTIFQKYYYFQRWTIKMDCPSRRNYIFSVVEAFKIIEYILYTRNRGFGISATKWQTYYSETIMWQKPVSLKLNFFLTCIVYFKKVWLIPKVFSKDTPTTPIRGSGVNIQF